MKTLLQTLFLFFLIMQICFAQWYQQNCGTTKNLYGVTFVDANNGWIVGDKGTILHTTNGGNDWNSQTSETNNLLEELAFTDLLHGTVVGDSGVILRTNDGGINWFQQISGTNARFCGVSFIDANIGWAVGYIDNPSNYYGIILHSENAGETWEQQFVLNNQFLFSVSFLDANNGWAVGCYGTILKTTDGGEIWLQQNSGSKFPLFDVSFVDENNGWAVGGCSDMIGIALKTSDGGINWTELIISPVKNVSVCFTSENIGMIVSNNMSSDKKILRTTDGGTSWDFQSSGTAVGLCDVFCTDALNAYAVGWDGTILHTTNGGITFVGGGFDRSPSEYFLSQNFPNPFNPSTKINWQSPVGNWQTLIVYDVLGNEMATLVNEYKPAGKYEVEFDASGLPSGVYFYQLKAGSFVESKKMILLK